MSKNKGFDFIADVHERANHNFHRSYWFNRVTSFTLAEWKANKYFASIYFAIYTLMGILLFNSIHQAALAANKSFWLVLFDFGDASTTARFAVILFYSILWVITGIATIQNLLQRIHVTPSTSQPERKKEKKKKYPKRPKNYK